MSVRVCGELCLISISNIRLLLVAVPSYYWYPPSHPSVLISSHFWRDSSPSLRPASARKILLLGEMREGEGEINGGVSWSQTDWLTDDCSNYLLKQNWFFLWNIRWEFAAGCYWNFPIVSFMGLIEYRRTLTDSNSVISSAGIRFYFWIKFLQLYIFYIFLHSMCLLPIENDGTFCKSNSTCQT